MNVHSKKAKELVDYLGKDKAEFYVKEQIDNSYSDGQAMFWNEVLKKITT